MQSKRPSRHAAALAAVLTFLLATPALLAAPAADGDPSWTSLASLRALWTDTVGAVSALFGRRDQASPPIDQGKPGSSERVFGYNGQHIDPDGSPQATSTVSTVPSLDGTGRSDGAGPTG